MSEGVPENWIRATANLCPVAPREGLPGNLAHPGRDVEGLILLNQESLPPTYRSGIPWAVQMAMKRGYVKPGWNLYDYLYCAFQGDPNLPQQTKGWEEVVIWGKQGGGKSNLTMQLMFVLYQDWDTVLKRVVLTPSEVIKLYRETKNLNGRIPILSLDDITTIFPKQLWFVSRAMYTVLQQFIATVRLRFSNIIASTPIPQNLIASLKENLTFEVVVNPNQTYEVERYAWLPDFEKPAFASLRKIYVENSSWDLMGIPADVWQEYEDRRWAITERIVARMEEEIDELDRKLGGGSEAQDEVTDIDPNLYYHPSEVLGVLAWTPSQLEKAVKKKVLTTVAYRGVLWFRKEEVNRLAEVFGQPKSKKGLSPDERARVDLATMTDVFAGTKGADPKAKGRKRTHKIEERLSIGEDIPVPRTPMSRELGPEALEEDEWDDAPAPAESPGDAEAEAEAEPGVDEEESG